jgi:hypothetical protein
MYNMILQILEDNILVVLDLGRHIWSREQDAVSACCLIVVEQVGCLVSKQNHVESGALEAVAVTILVRSRNVGLDEMKNKMKGASC